MGKRKPSDYPQLNFRVLADEKQEIFDLLDKAKDVLNKNKSDDDYLIKKNQILTSAIKQGLKEIIKSRKIV